MANPYPTPDENKSLFLLLYILLCQRVVALGDKYGNVGIENIICNADSEVFLALAGDKLPFALETVWSSIDYTDITHMPLARFDKTNIQVRTTLLNDTHFTVKALCDGIGNVDPIFPVTSSRSISALGRVCPKEFAAASKIITSMKNSLFMAQRYKKCGFFIIPHPYEVKA